MWFRSHPTPPRARLVLEPLEGRAVPAAYTAKNAAELIADIAATNHDGGTNAITLKADKIFTLTAVNNTTDGPTGLPVVAPGNNLTIIGNGDTLQRKTNAATPAFRLLDVADGASLFLRDVTLTGGSSIGPGGAINNHGRLTLENVVITANTALPSAGSTSALGGGIYSDGALDVTNSTISNNTATGAHGTDFHAGVGGDAFGGGVYVGAGTAALTNVTVSGNTTQGGVGGSGGSTGLSGNGGDGGDGYGGGLYVATGSVTLRGTTTTENAALGGKGGAHGVSGKTGQPGHKGHIGKGFGGGIGIAADAMVYLDAFSAEHVTGNQASKADPDIRGTYHPAL